MAFKKVKFSNVAYNETTGEIIADFEIVTPQFALKFDGLTQLLETTVLGSQFSQSVNSISAKFKFHSFPSGHEGFLLGVWGSGANKSKFKLNLVNASTLKIYTRNSADTSSSVQSLTLANALQLETEYHILFVISNGIGTLYIDGVKVGEVMSLSLPMAPGGTNASIGTERDASGNPTNATIRELKMYVDKALTDQEAADEFAGFTIPGMNYRYPLTEGVGYPNDVIGGESSVRLTGTWIQTNA